MRNSSILNGTPTPKEKNTKTKQQQKNNPNNKTNQKPKKRYTLFLNPMLYCMLLPTYVFTNEICKNYYLD